MNPDFVERESPVVNWGIRRNYLKQCQKIFTSSPVESCGAALSNLFIKLSQFVKCSFGNQVRQINVTRSFGHEFVYDECRLVFSFGINRLKRMIFIFRPIFMAALQTCQAENGVRPDGFAGFES